MKLISFSVSNYKSFLTEQSVELNLDGKNVDAFFGPNGSGKSNLFEAMVFYKNFIRTSTSFQGRKIPYAPFLFNVNAHAKPTKFKAEMEIDSSVYSYSFSLLDGKVTAEVLKHKKTDAIAGGYETLFSRSSVNKRYYDEAGFTSALLKATRADALLLTKAWENNNQYALQVFRWLDHFRFLTGDQSENITAKKIMESSTFKDKVLDLLRRADLFIQDIQVSEVQMPDDLFNSLPLTDEVKTQIDKVGYNVTTTHLVYDDAGVVVGAQAVPMNGTESKGTMRMFQLAYPIIDTLEKGNVLYIDEFETHLHSRESRFIIELFRSKENKKNAQLLLNTHNTQLIDLLGRNSVHLTGKNKREETVIGRIPNSIRPDDPSLEKKYTKGMFGAVPNIKW